MNGWPMRRQRGFSLLEILVAFTIMAISLGMLYRVSGSTVRTTAEVEQNQRALVLLESLLAARESVPASGIRESGEAAGFSWSVQSAPYPTPVSDSSPNAPPLHQLTAIVEWPGSAQRKRIEVSSLVPQRKPGLEVRK